MDQNQVQYFKSTFLPSFQIWTQIRQDVLFSKILSNSSQSVDNFDPILLAFVRKTFNKIEDKPFQIWSNILFRQRHKHKPSKMNKYFNKLFVGVIDMNLQGTKQISKLISKTDFASELQLWRK